MAPSSGRAGRDRPGPSSRRREGPKILGAIRGADGGWQNRIDDRRVRMRPPASKLVGVLLLAAIGLLSNALLLRRTESVEAAGLGTGDVGSYLRRFDPLRRELPTHVTVGYESDLEDSLTDRQEVKRFYLAQYALAPVIVVAGAKPDLVVGN